MKCTKNVTAIAGEATYESNRSSGSRSNHWVVPASRFTERRSMCFWKGGGKYGYLYDIIRNSQGGYIETQNE